MAKIKEKIFHEIDTMNLDELSLVYENIQLIKIIKKSKHDIQDDYSIDEIQRMTSSSKKSWAEIVVSEREDRL